MSDDLTWYSGTTDFRDSLEKVRNYLDKVQLDITEDPSYVNKRGSMVIDVVASRQRKYVSRVVPLVSQWELSVSSPSLSELAKTKLDQKTFGLRTGEAETIQQVAIGLIRFGSDFGLSDEEKICLKWAQSVDPLRFTPKLDPYVGSIDGIGIALFAYARKLCGAEAIKPDVRVRNRLQALGVRVPEGSQALMLLCELLADGLEIPRARFDSLLWTEPD